MAEKKTFWRETWGQVLIAVLTTGIVTFVGWIYDWLPHILGFLRIALDWAWNVGAAVVGWTVATHGVWGWALILLGLGAGFALFFIYFMWSAWRTDKRPPSFRNYVEDEIFNVRWHWKYTRQGRIYNLWCHCIHDITPLVFRSDYNFIGLYCETCKREFNQETPYKEELDNMVKRQIQRKINSKEYVRILKEQQAAATMALTAVERK